MQLLIRTTSMGPGFYSLMPMMPDMLPNTAQCKPYIDRQCWYTRKDSQMSAATTALQSSYTCRHQIAEAVGQTEMSTGHDRHLANPSQPCINGVLKRGAVMCVKIKLWSSGTETQ